MIEIADWHRRGGAEFDKRVRLITDDQWENKTPCTEWNVRDLVNHLVYETKWSVPILEGRTIEEVGDEFEGDLLGDDPKATWDEAIAESVDAVARLGDKSDLVHVSWGQIPRDEYLRQLSNDLVCHSWDLARGIGGDDQLDPELVHACYEYLKPHEDTVRSSGVFGDEVPVPDDADEQTKLLGLIGRRA